MKRKKLLFLGIDTSTVDAIKYAKSKNVYTIVTDFNSPEIKQEKKAAECRKGQRNLQGKMPGGGAADTKRVSPGSGFFRKGSGNDPIPGHCQAE